MPKLSKLY